MVKRRNLKSRRILIECAICKSSFKVRCRRAWALYILPACSSDCALELINSIRIPLNLSRFKIIDIAQFRRGFKSRPEMLLYDWLKKHNVDFMFESIGIKLKSGVYIPDFVLMDFGIIEVKDLTRSDVNISKVLELGKYIPTYIMEAAQVERIAK